MRELGKRIRQRRVKAGLSLRGLAEQVGKSHAWLHNLETGQMEDPRAEDLTALAEILGDQPEEYLRLAGRVNLTAARIVPAADGMPVWARRLETAISDLRERVEVLATAQADQQEFLGSEIEAVAVLVRALAPSDTSSGGSETDPAEHPAETTNGRAGR